MKTIHVKGNENGRLTKLSAGDDLRLISENGKSVYVTAKESHSLCDGCVFKDYHSEAFRTIGSCLSLRISCLGVILVDARAIMEEL